MSKSISLDIHLKIGSCGHMQVRKGKKPAHAKPTRIPRITRLMALAIKYEQLYENGVIEEHYTLARMAGVDRSQISRILRLRLLAPEIQEAVLNLPDSEDGKEPFSWRELDSLTRILVWEEQIQKFNGMLPSDLQQSG